MKKYIIIFILLILVVGGFFLYQSNDNESSDQNAYDDQTVPTPTPSTTLNATPTPATSATGTVSTKGLNDAVLLDNLLVNQKITSPITIKGKAKGWYFEGSFPVEIHDANNKLLASGPAQAKGDWMTSDYVPFEIKLTFDKQTAGTKGFISFKKDNPSGLPENEDSVLIPVTF